MANEQEQQGGRARGAHFRQPGTEPQQQSSGFSWGSNADGGGSRNVSLDDTDAFLEAVRISQEARRRRAESQPAALPETTSASQPVHSSEPQQPTSRQHARRAQESAWPAALPPAAAASTPYPVRESVNPYQNESRRQSYAGSYAGRKNPYKDHFKVVYAIIIVVIILVAIVGVAGAMYISHINTKLTEKVTPALREELVETQAGDPFYMLLLGIDKDQSRWEGDDSADYGADESNYRSDSIMLCRIDPQNVKVTMVSIHRDTIVDLDEHGQQKINNAYSYGGAAYATEVVSDFAGVDISHYAEIDLDRFINVVEQVGGITVTLPVPVRDPEYTGLNLPAGTQTLDGTTAALLCRCRHGYDEYGDGDKYRAANQRMVFSEVIKKVLSSDPATMMATISTMAESVTTDMDIGMILELANQMKSLNTETDIMTGMEPTEGVYQNDTWYEVCITSQWKKMMERVDQGLPPYDTAEGEYDSTAGVAGGVGQDGQQAVANAIAADNAEATMSEAEETEDSGEEDGGDGGTDSEDGSNNPENG